MRLDETLRLVYKELDNDYNKEIRNANISGYRIYDNAYIHFLSFIRESDIIIGVEETEKFIVKVFEQSEFEGETFEAEVVYKDGSSKRLI